MPSEPLLFVLEPHDLRSRLEVGESVMTSHDGYLRVRADLGSLGYLVHRDPRLPRDWRPIGPYTISTLRADERA